MPKPKQPRKNWVHAQYELWAEISYTTTGRSGGREKSLRLPVEQFTASFGINSIPRADISVSVGVTSTGISNIHNKASSLSSMAKAKVYFKPEGAYDGIDNWPSTENGLMIFDGYVTAINPSKQVGSFSVVLTLVHWAHALTFTSSLSPSLVAGNAGTLDYSAIQPFLKSQTGAAGGDNAGANLSKLSVSKSLGYASIVADVWKGVKDLFCDMAGIDLMAFYGSVCTITNKSTNQDAINALRRFEGGSGGSGCGFSGDGSFNVPSALDLAGGVSGTAVGDAICDTIGSLATADVANQTFWDLLVNIICPIFQLAVIPMTDRCLVVPWCQGLRQPWRDTLARDTLSVGINKGLDRPLRGVVVIASPAFISGANAAAAVTSTGARVAPNQVAGCFFPSAKEATNGTIMPVSPPPWLARLATVDQVAGKTSGVQGRVAVPTATMPQASADRGATPPAGVMRLSQGIYSRYAQSVYVNETLRGRSGTTVAANFRLDIAPGSQITVSGGALPSLGNKDAQGVSYQGAVAQVSLVLSASQRVAQAAYTLVGIRTLEENKTDRFSVARHPLYQQSFTGAPLHPSFKTLGKGK